MTVDAGTDVTFVPVGAVSDLTPGEGRAYVIGATQIAVFLLRDGTVHATGAECPHRGGPIADGQIDGAKVMCPLHQYTYAFIDGTCNNPSIPALIVHTARVVDGVIEVALSG